MGMGMGMGVGMGAADPAMVAQQQMMIQELHRQRVLQEMALIQQQTMQHIAAQQAMATGIIAQQRQVLGSAAASNNGVDIGALLGQQQQQQLLRRKAPKKELYKRDEMIDLVLTISKTTLTEAMRCCIIVRLASATKTFNGHQVDKSPQRTDLCQTSTDPEFKKDSFCFRVPAVVKESKDKFVLRLFKIDEATQKRQVAAVGVIPLAKAAKHLMHGKAHKFKCKFKYGAAGKLEDVGVIHVRVDLLANGGSP